MFIRHTQLPAQWQTEDWASAIAINCFEYSARRCNYTISRIIQKQIPAFVGMIAKKNKIQADLAAWLLKQPLHAMLIYL